MSNAASRSKPVVRQSTLSDCHELAATMRREDAEEVRLFSNATPLKALLHGFEWPMCWTVEYQGKVVAMFGVGGTYGQLGFPWMLASDDLSKIRKSFLKECRKYVAHMQLFYPQLTGYAWAKNDKHLQWLSWLGFKLFPAQPMGVHEADFVPFYKENHLNV